MTKKKKKRLNACFPLQHVFSLSLPCHLCSYYANSGHQHSLHGLLLELVDVFCPWLCPSTLCPSFQQPRWDEMRMVLFALHTPIYTLEKSWTWWGPIIILSHFSLLRIYLMFLRASHVTFSGLATLLSVLHQPLYPLLFLASFYPLYKFHLIHCCIANI